ncbi:MAG: ribonucleoside hydrolase RihC [Oscillospiraceae bacterium]|jgi:non-specific riboncleoside hydrolase|nr:ribonucleoside hydrolase RihC [Oscillospiraceae bacterium]
MKKRPLMIDTDPGIDDAVALALALFSEQLDVRLITTVSGNVSLPKVTKNVLKLLAFYRKEVPVAAGAPEPLLRPAVDASEIHGESGLAGYDFPAPDDRLLLKENAVCAMRRVLLESPEPVTLMTIAPLTNVALLLKTFPEVKPHIREIVMMGASTGRGNLTVMGEFNITVDPEAAEIVFRSGVPITVAPLDVGLQAAILPQDSEQLRKMGGVGGMIYCLFHQYRAGSMEQGLQMYDSCAAAYLLKPELFQTKPAYVEIETASPLTAGCSVMDFVSDHPNALICTQVNAEAFRLWLVEQIRNCRIG